MFATVLTIIAPIWRPDFNAGSHGAVSSIQLLSNSLIHELFF